MQIYDTFWRKNDALKTLYFAYVFHRYDMNGNQQKETENTHNIHTRTLIVSDHVLRQNSFWKVFVTACSKIMVVYIILLSWIPKCRNVLH